MNWNRIYTLIKTRTYITFAVVALVSGIATAVAVPTMLGIDEFRHFNRVIQLSQGGWSSDVQGESIGGVVPTAVADYEWWVVDSAIRGVNTQEGWGDTYGKAFEVPMDGPERMESFPGAAAYNVFAYAPAIPIVGVMDLLNTSVGAALLGARIAMLIVFVGIISVALYLVRQYKIRWFIVAIALLPKTIFLAATLTADTMAISVAILLFAIIYIRFVEGRVSQVWAAIAVAAAVVLSLVKFTYLPLSLLAIPVVNDIFQIKSKYGRLVVWLVCTIVIATPALAWTLSVASHADSNNSAPPVVAGVESTVEGKIMFLIESPDRVITLLPKTFIQNSSGEGDYMHTMVGNIGFNDVRTPTVAVIGSWIVLLMAAWYAGGEIKNSHRRRRFVIQALVASGIAIFIVFGVLYVSWTAAGSDIVEGVQGRYFLPAIIFLLPVLPYLVRINIKIADGTVKRVVIWGSTICFIIAMLMYVVVTYRLL